MLHAFPSRVGKMFGVLWMPPTVELTHRVWTAWGAWCQPEQLLGLLWRSLQVALLPELWARQHPSALCFPPFPCAAPQGLQEAAVGHPTKLHKGAYLHLNGCMASFTSEHHWKPSSCAGLVLLRIYPLCQSCPIYPAHLNPDPLYSELPFTGLIKYVRNK